MKSSKRWPRSRPYPAIGLGFRSERRSADTERAARRGDMAQSFWSGAMPRLRGAGSDGIDAPTFTHVARANAPLMVTIDKEAKGDCGVCP